MSKASIFNTEWEDLIRAAARGAAGLPAIVDRLNSMETNLMSALDRIREEVAESKSVSTSAVALIKGLAEKLNTAVNSGDWTEVETLASELDASTSELAAAIAANTPAAPIAEAEGPPVEVPPAEPTPQ